jgi:hypothetical protein
MIIVAVDHGHVDRRPAQLLGRGEPAEPGPDDHDTRPLPLRPLRDPAWAGRL